MGRPVPGVDLEGGNGKLERDAAGGSRGPPKVFGCHVIEAGRDWTRSVCGTFAICDLRTARTTHGSKGPCCAASMRWVLNYRPNVKWYLFQDDDLYVKGPALVALLRYDPDRAVYFRPQ